jgi:hypothetical protein
MLGGRDDVAVLWDIRVSPRERGGAIDRFADPGQPAEVQLLWWKPLVPPDTKSS